MIRLLQWQHHDDRRELVLAFHEALRKYQVETAARLLAVDAVADSVQLTGHTLFRLQKRYALPGSGRLLPTPLIAAILREAPFKPGGFGESERRWLRYTARPAAAAAIAAAGWSRRRAAASAFARAADAEEE